MLHIWPKFVTSCRTAFIYLFQIFKSCSLLRLPSAGHITHRLSGNLGNIRQTQQAPLQPTPAFMLLVTKAVPHVWLLVSDLFCAAKDKLLWEYLTSLTSVNQFTMHKRAKIQEFMSESETHNQQRHRGLRTGRGAAPTPSSSSAAAALWLSHVLKLCELEHIQQPIAEQGPHDVISDQAHTSSRHTLIQTHTGLLVHWGHLVDGWRTAEVIWRHLCNSRRSLKHHQALRGWTSSRPALSPNHKVQSRLSE